MGAGLSPRCVRRARVRDRLCADEAQAARAEAAGRPGSARGRLIPARAEQQYLVTRCTRWCHISRMRLWSATRARVAGMILVASAAIVGVAYFVTKESKVTTPEKRIGTDAPRCPHIPHKHRPA